MLSNLIKALTIFLKYGNPDYPTGCEHDEFRVFVSPFDISSEDISALNDLGFIIDDENDCFLSYRYGSA